MEHWHMQQSQIYMALGVTHFIILFGYISTIIINARRLTLKYKEKDRGAGACKGPCVNGVGRSSKWN